MRLLLDENLSPRLVSRLLSLFAELIHVREAGLQQATDRDIWDWAKANQYAIITADADFVALSKRLGCPPKVIHVEQCDFPFRNIEDLLRRSALRISEFHKDAESGLLSLRFGASQQ